MTDFELKSFLANLILESKKYKIQQDYQLDRTKRDEKKTQYQGTEEEESSHIDKINSTASEIANIDGEELFRRKNTPKEIHSMYPEIRAVYSRESLKESLKESMFDVLKSRNLF